MQFKTSEFLQLAPLMSKSFTIYFSINNPKLFWPCYSLDICFLFEKVFWKFFSFHLLSGILIPEDEGVVENEMSIQSSGVLLGHVP